jgi:hypothetical protein
MKCTDQARNILYHHDVTLAVPSAILNCSAHSGRQDNHVLPADIICRHTVFSYTIFIYAPRSGSRMGLTFLEGGAR